MGKWRPCERCSKATAHRLRVPKATDIRATAKLECLYNDLTGPFREPIFGNKNCAMLFVDDYTRMKFIRFLRKKSDTKEARKNFIADVAMPAGRRSSTSAPMRGENSTEAFKRY